MNRKLKHSFKPFLHFAALLAALVANTNPTRAGTILQPADGSAVAFEADIGLANIQNTADTTKVSWISTNDPTASGGTALCEYTTNTPPWEGGINGANGPQFGRPNSFVTYNINFSQAGTYYVYYRWRADPAVVAAVSDNSQGNSFFVANTFGTFTTPGVTSPFSVAVANAVPAPASTSYQWAREPGAYTVGAPGVEVFSIGDREWGLSLDRIVISQDNALTSAQLDALPDSGGGSPTTVFWTGAVNGNWDTTTANWTNSVPVNVYNSGDPVQFDDTATGSTSVNVVSVVTPGNVIVTNNVKNYTIGGSAIGGPKSLTKSGSGTLTLSGANTFSGGTTVSGGTLLVNDGSLGSGPVALSGAAALTLKSGLQQIDLAPFQNTAVPISAWAAFPASAAFDNATTPDGSRWVATENSDPGWIYIDLGQDYLLGQVKIGWEVAAAADYTIRTATSAQGTYGDDLTQWTVAGTVTGNGRGSNPFNGNYVTTTLNAPTTARYLGMYGTSRASPYSYSIWEMQAFGYGGAAAYTIASLSSPDATTSVNLETNVTLVVGTNNTSTTFAGHVTGYGGLTKLGTGTLTLSGVNTYSGATMVGNGTLLVNGSLGSSSAVTVQNGGTLGGNGTIGGAATVQGGGTLVPGTTSIGTLTLNNTLTLAAGSTSAMRLNKTGGVRANDLVQGMTGVAYNGTLTVTNVTSDATALANGDQFILFAKASGTYGGSFSSINLPTLPAGFAWDTTRLGVDGSIQVLQGSPAAAPTFSPPAGGYVGAQSVTISSSTAGATIYYTTDGSDPATSGTRLSGLTPITGVSVPAPASMTIKAYATHVGFVPSLVAIATYGTVTTPIWTSLAGGSWTNSGNWLNGVIATGTGISADFSELTLAAAPVVTLDGPRTIGNLIFGDVGDQYGWTLNSGSNGLLTLAVSSGSPTINVSNQTATIGAVLAGSSGFTKDGPGTLTLSASNTYSGPTAITGGTLAVTPGAALGSGLVTLSGGAALSLVGTFQQFDLAPFKNTAVAQDYTPGWLPSYAFDGNTGTRWVGLNNSDPNWIYIDLGSDHVLTQVKIAWEYASAQDYTIRTATSAQGTYGNDLTQWTVAGTVTGNGPGTTVTTTLTVPTTARYLGMYGTSRASPYSYSIWEMQAFGYAAVTDTIASLSSADPTASVNLDPNVTLNVGTDNTSTSFAGIVTGGGALTKQGTGTLTLSGLNTYTGSTTVSNGTLALSDTAGAFSTIANSPVATVASGATLDVSGISSGFHLLTGQSLWGSGSVNGAVAVDFGATLTVGGGAGTPGTLSFNDSLTLGGSTLLRIGKGLVPSNDVVRVTGLFTSGGTLVVSNVGGTLALGDSFKLFSAGSYSGAFVASSLPNLGLGLAWDTSQLAVSGVITVARATGPPLILVQPQGTNVVEGTTVTLSVSATGTMPLHYQWYSSTGALPNQTNATLVLNNVLVADSYYVTVDNSVGPTATSDTVLVTVEQAPPPQIVVPPLALFLPVGSHATFSVAAFSTLPISYQWQFNYADIPDATNASLTVTNAQLTDAGTYAVNVSNIRGFTNAAPASLNLTTLPLLYIPIANPSFEIPVLADGAVGSPAGWTTSGGWASWNPQNGQWAGATYGDPPPSTIPDGNNVYQMSGAGSYVTQVLGTNYSAGAHYQLSVFVGARGDEGGGYSGNYQIQLLRGDTHAVVAETTGSLGAGDRGAWQQVLVNFDATSAQAGTPMEVRAINSSGGQVGVDNFSLWFTNSLPPQPPQPVLDPSRFTTPSGVPTFNFDTVAGYKYRLVYTANVANAMTAWLPVIDEPNYPASRDGWSITSGGQAMTIQDLHTAGQPHRFYRIEAATP